jgi:hypothetical protein
VTVEAIQDPDDEHGPDQAEFTEEEQAVLARVGAVLRKIQFGTVSLVVQDGRVVQIETAEKFRLR